MIPDWLTALAWISVTLGGISAIGITTNLSKRPQPMMVMNAVWPLCALAGHLFVVAFYLRYGQSSTDTANHRHHHFATDTTEPHQHDHAHVQHSSNEHHSTTTHPHHHASAQPFAAQVAKGTLHCGAGCTLGDIIAESLLFTIPGLGTVFGWHWLFDDALFAGWIFDFIVAFGFGIAFQYLAIKPMGSMTVHQALKAALKADFLSLTFWQVGMYAFMAIAHFWIFGYLLHADLNAGEVSFWLMMQLAMICGFITAYPANAVLIRRGIKEAM